MKKGLKITLIVLVVMVGVVVLDTLQAKVFDNSPLLKIRENLDGGSTDYIDKGLLVNHYHCNNDEKITTWKGTKFACSAKESKKEIKEIVDLVARDNLSCDEALEKFYQDENYTYSYSCIKSDKVIVKYSDGSEETVKDALQNNRITIQDLDRFNISYIKEEIENNEECCEGCMCGDTIKLLKTTETAWMLTKINSNGEYEQIKDAFINFHGTGKNNFAFFKYDEEVKGEFTINKNNEIVLIPNDKNNKITCKLGEEKDLIAVMYCDNNFGTFTLQKHGTLELPSIIKDNVSKTKTIKVKGHQSITEEKEISAFLSVINNSKVWTGLVTLPSPKYELELFDVNNNSIAKILYNPGNYFNIEINGKSYELTNIDKNSLNTILEE